MKHNTIITLMTAILAALLLTAGGKDLRVLTVTPTPQMHCASCENKIKGNLRFEKGVVKIETSLEAQTVTITYHAKKTNVEKLKAAFKKIGYEVKVVKDEPKGKE